MPSQILGWDNTGSSGLKKTDLDTEVLDHHGAPCPLPIPPSCDRADLVQLLAPGSAQVIWWTQQPQHLQKKMRQRWRNLTDITPVTRSKEFHDGENVKWGRSTVRDDWLMCVYLHQIGWFFGKCPNSPATSANNVMQARPSFFQARPLMDNSLLRSPTLFCFSYCATPGVLHPDNMVHFCLHFVP